MDASHHSTWPRDRRRARFRQTSHVTFVLRLGTRSCVDRLPGWQAKLCFDDGHCWATPSVDAKLVTRIFSFEVSSEATGAAPMLWSYPAKASGGEDIIQVFISEQLGQLGLETRDCRQSHLSQVKWLNLQGPPREILSLRSRASHTSKAWHRIVSRWCPSTFFI